MAQRKLTINLPSSSDALHTVLQLLLRHNLISEEIARTIEQQETGKKLKAKSRWEQAAERLRSENYLKGRSGEVNKLFREFREDFEL